MKRTSLTHPLQIAAIPVRASFGQVGITFCPGKYDQEAMTGYWDRDLDLDLDTIHAWGAAALVTLLEQKELSLLRVEGLGEKVVQPGTLWFHLPIADVSIPDDAFESKWAETGSKLCAILRWRQHVLVHCREGCCQSKGNRSPIFRGC